MAQNNPYPPFQGRIVSLGPAHRDWLRQLWLERWGSNFIVSRGQVHHSSDLPGFLALAHAPCEADVLEVCGMVTYDIQGTECEIVSLDSLVEGRGAGTALVAAVRQAAEAASCRRLWLVTTNDNLPALRFYQRGGFRLAAVHAGAVNQTRRLKPSLPLTGLDGIPLRDEIELELQLSPAKTPVVPDEVPGARPSSPIQGDTVAESLSVSSGYAQPAAPIPLPHFAQPDGGGWEEAQPAAHTNLPNPAGTRLARRPIYESRWINLYLDHMRTPSGREIVDFHVVDYPNQAVAMVVSNSKGEVLLGRYPRYTIGQVRWEVPAGGIEPGEDPLAAAQREVYEETGYMVHTLEHYYTYYPTAGSTNKVFHLVRAQVGERTGSLDPHEVEQIRWFTVEELKQMIQRKEIQDGYTLTALLLAWELSNI